MANSKSQYWVNPVFEHTDEIKHNERFAFEFEYLGDSTIDKVTGCWCNSKRIEGNKIIGSQLVEYSKHRTDNPQLNTRELKVHLANGEKHILIIKYSVYK